MREKLQKTRRQRRPKRKRKRKAKKGKRQRKLMFLFLIQQEEFLSTRTQVGPSDATLELKAQIERQTKEWGSKNESENFNQRHDIELVRQEVRPSVEDKVKKAVEEIMTVELESLRVKRGIKKEKETKQKPIRDPKRKNLLEIKLLKIKGVRQWLEEVVEVGILKKLKPANLEDFVGDMNLMGALQQRTFALMPDPSPQQIRQLIVEYCAIPLGCQRAHDLMGLEPEKALFCNELNIHNVLFYGPMGSGKTLMLRALASACNALLFDLTPSNIEGKYEKAKAKQIAMAAALVAKEFTPSIIFVDEAEKLFPGGKKKAKGVAAVLKKTFAEMKKKRENYFDKKDRVLFVFLTNKPFDCSAKEMKTFFDKKIYFPYPNYSGRQDLFKYLIEKRGGKLDENFPLTTLASISEGFTGGSVSLLISVPIRNRESVNRPASQIIARTSSPAARILRRLGFFILPFRQRVSEDTRIHRRSDGNQGSSRTEKEEG